jgi:predicted nuclease with TOPRIM domain
MIILKTIEELRLMRESANEILKERLDKMDGEFKKLYQRQSELEEIIDGVACIFVEHTATLDERMNEQVEIFKKRLTNYVNNRKQ